ncbi:MAG: LamG domain-containing protein [Phycisphaerae bacterium]
MPLLKPVRSLQINFSHPLARGLAGCWLLNEGTGKSIADYGLCRRHGKFHYSTTAPTWKAGKYGSCLEFGSERCIEIPGCHKFGWDITQELSVVALVNHSANQNNTIFARSKFIHPIRLAGLTSGKVRLWVYTNGTDCDLLSTSSHSINGSEWIHAAGTWRVGDGKLYVNGVLEASESSSTGILNTTDNKFVGIGGTYEAGYQECWIGKIEYVFIYNRVLCAEEVEWLYREPFAMFESPISPESMLASIAVVTLVGSVNAQSVTSAILKSLSKISGTVTSISDVTALLESIRGSQEIERNWLREALFNGMTTNAFKLGTTLSLGWFWARVAGCSVLYRGLTMEQIDFTNMLTVDGQNACVISPPGYLPHSSSSTYFYVIRRFNKCGYQEHTLTAAVKVSIDANGDLEQPQPNKVFSSRAEQVSGSKIRLVWFYCPLEQRSQPVCFNVYYDGRTGQIDYEIPLAKISYQRQKFYSYQSDTLDAGKYLFAIRAEDAGGMENSSLAQLSIQLNAANLDPIGILSAEHV